MWHISLDQGPSSKNQTNLFPETTMAPNPDQGPESQTPARTKPVPETQTKTEKGPDPGLQSRTKSQRAPEMTKQPETALDPGLGKQRGLGTGLNPGRGAERGPGPEMPAGGGTGPGPVAEADESESDPEIGTEIAATGDATHEVVMATVVTDEEGPGRRSGTPGGGAALRLLPLQIQRSPRETSPR